MTPVSDDRPRPRARFVRPRQLDRLGIPFPSVQQSIEAILENSDLSNLQRIETLANLYFTRHRYTDQTMIETDFARILLAIQVSAFKETFKQKRFKK